MRLTREQLLLRCLAQTMREGIMGYRSSEQAYEELKAWTGQDFGYDIDAWKKWFKTAKRPFPNINKSTELNSNANIPFIFNKESNLASFERVDGIAFCGENPQIMLYDENDKYTAVASYWRSVYSPVGEGNVLLLYLDENNSKNTQHPSYAIYSDNLPLAEYLTLTFNQHFDEYKSLNFGEVKAQKAAFLQESDSQHYHRVKCRTNSQYIVLNWSDVRLRQLFILKDLNEGGFGKAGDEHYDVYTNIFTCAKASIKLNGQTLSGTIRTKQEGEIFRSSAFMAFSETWIKRS